MLISFQIPPFSQSTLQHENGVFKFIHFGDRLKKASFLNKNAASVWTEGQNGEKKMCFQTKNISVDKACIYKHLFELKCGTEIGSHLYNESVCGISSLLDIPRSMVRGFIGNWKHLGTADYVKTASSGNLQYFVE